MQAIDKRTLEKLYAERYKDLQDKQTVYNRLSQEIADGMGGLREMERLLALFSEKKPAPEPEEEDEEEDTVYNHKKEQWQPRKEAEKDIEKPTKKQTKKPEPKDEEDSEEEEDAGDGWA